MANNLKRGAAIVFAFLLSAPGYTKPYYATDSLDQYTRYHSCQKCNLSNMYLEGYENAILDDSILISAHLQGVFNGASFVNTILTQASLDVEALHANFSGAQCNYANFAQTRLSGSNFQEANLSHASFKGANLSSADFTNASLKGACLDFSVLIGATLTAEQLHSAKSYYCAVLPDGTLSPAKYASLKCSDSWLFNSMVAFIVGHHLPQDFVLSRNHSGANKELPG